MLLTIIIINYNGAAFIRNCLDSVLSQRAFFNAFNVVVVDNASTDDSIRVLNDYKDQIMIIENKINVGFSAAHNQLLDQLDTPYIWLLNNDTEFNNTQDVISPIIDYFNHHETVVGISPKLLNTDGSLQNQGSGLSSWAFKSKKIKAVGFLSGASLFIRTQFFKDINGFDPNLFFYNDDFDFAMQVKKHHKTLIYFPMIEITHHGGLSTKFKPIETTIGGYYGSVYLCKKYYSNFIFLIYKFLIQRFIDFKLIYYFLNPTNVADDWKKELKKLKLKLKHEI